MRSKDKAFGSLKEQVVSLKEENDKLADELHSNRDRLNVAEVSVKY